VKTFEQNLQSYAELAVRVGVNVQPNQELILTANINEVPLVRKIVAEAYKAGAKNVEVLYHDDEDTLSLFQHGHSQALEYAPQWFYDALATAYEQGAARLSIYGGNPALLKHIDPDKVAKHSKVQSQAAKRLGELVSGFAINWSIISYANPVWAKMVFPDDSEEVAVNKLWDAIFKVSRVDQPDPVAAWQQHCEALTKRKNFLNQKKYAALLFRGPGTNLKVALADGHLWEGAWGQAKNGVRCVPNIPTEEVFTMPHKYRVDGYVSSTKPLSLRGQMIEHIYVRFEKGKVVEAKAAKGEDVLKKFLETDEGANYLGEVALVPYSSPVSQTNILFYNALFDENAACHIALGRAYEENLEGFQHLTPEEREKRGYNDSLVHEDWMIGSDEVDVDAMTQSGQVEPLMQRGEWV
jgi:aminopeptidase